MGVPYPGAAQNVNIGAVPTTPIAISGTYISDLTQSRGANISVWVKVTHAATLHIKRYADAAGLFLVDDTTQALVANTLTNKAIADGLLFTYFQITIVNSAGATMTISNLAVLQ